jgi:hypothetical protein
MSIICNKIQSLTPSDMISESSFFTVSYDKKTFGISLHHDYPIESATFNGENIKIHIFSNWNEIILYNIDGIKINKKTHFNKFSLKIPSSNSVYFNHFNKDYNLKYSHIEYLPLKMISSNPLLMYYVFKVKKRVDIKSGDPIIDENNKLVGIFSKLEGNNLYVIPSVYILKTFEKSNPYYLDTDITQITKINNYKIKNKNIFYRKIGIPIPVSAYLLLECNKNSKIYFYCNMKRETMVSKDFTNKFHFKISNYIKINKTSILVTSAFLSYLLINNYQEYLFKIVIERKKIESVIIDQNKFNLVF